MENGDTSTFNDLVTKQYENLPYPGFSRLEISKEEKHYKKNIETPFAISFAHTLEKHNHYLHRGDESFQ